MLYNFLGWYEVLTLSLWYYSLLYCLHCYRFFLYSYTNDTYYILGAYSMIPFTSINSFSAYNSLVCICYYSSFTNEEKKVREVNCPRLQNQR